MHTKSFEIKSMPKLETLKCQDRPDNDSDDDEDIEIWTLFPKLSTNRNFKIADVNGSITPENGFWDIKVKRLDLFANTHFYTQNMGHKKDTGL